MKYLLTLATLLLMVSCDEGGGWYAYRQLINETDYSVTLEVLSEGNWYQYEIAPQGELSMAGICLTGIDGRGCNLGWLGSADSSLVIFNDEMALKYRRRGYYSCEERNIGVDPFTECHGYEPMELGGDTIQYTYRITEADYQSAQPITE